MWTSSDKGKGVSVFRGISGISLVYRGLCCSSSGYLMKKALHETTENNQG